MVWMSFMVPYYFNFFVCVCTSLLTRLLTGTNRRRGDGKADASKGLVGNRFVVVLHLQCRFYTRHKRHKWCWRRYISSFSCLLLELGPMHLWPQSIRTTVNTMLETKFPMILFWSRSFHFLYNDSEIPIRKWLSFISSSTLSGHP